MSEAGRDARPGSKNKKPVAIIVGSTFAAFIIVIALLVLLYVKLTKGGKKARGIAIGETAAAGAAGAKKGHAMSGIIIPLLHLHSSHHHNNTTPKY